MDQKWQVVVILRLFVPCGAEKCWFPVFFSAMAAIALLETRRQAVEAAPGSPALALGTAGAATHCGQGSASTSGRDPRAWSFYSAAFWGSPSPTGAQRVMVAEDEVPPFSLDPQLPRETFPVLFGFKAALQLDFSLHSAPSASCKCQNVLLSHQQFLVLIFKMMLTVKQGNHHCLFKVALCLPDSPTFYWDLAILERAQEWWATKRCLISCSPKRC